MAGWMMTRNCCSIIKYYHQQQQNKTEKNERGGNYLKPILSWPIGCTFSFLNFEELSWLPHWVTLSR